MSVPFVYNDGAPHQPYDLMRKRMREEKKPSSWHVLMWSSWDSATGLGSPHWTSGMAGGSKNFCADVENLRIQKSHLVPCGSWLDRAYRVKPGKDNKTLQEAQSSARGLAEDACIRSTERLARDGEPCFSLSLATVSQETSVQSTTQIDDKPSLESLIEKAKNASDLDRRRLLLLDMSGIVRHTTPLHGGNAHSDIYKWEVGYAIWQAIKTLAPSVQTAKP